VIAKEE